MVRVANAVNASIQGFQSLNTTGPIGWTGRTFISSDGSLTISNPDGTGGNPDFSVTNAGKGIITVLGDSGSVTGNIITLTGGGSGAFFTGVGTVMTEKFNYLKLPNSTNAGFGTIYLNNVPYFHNYFNGIANALFVGANAGNLTNGATGPGNVVAIGNSVLNSLTNGNVNNSVLIGSNAAQNLATGNIADSVLIGKNVAQSSDVTQLGGTVAIGSTALANISSGFAQHSVFIGYLSANSVTTGNLGYCVAIGQNSLGSTNTGDSSGSVAIGYQAMLSATAASKNVAIGWNSLSALTTGTTNLAIGYSTGGNGAGIGITTGSYNTVIGGSSGSNYTSSESSNILISNSGTLGESNTIRIGTQGSGNEQQNTCFIAGIASVAVSNALPVVINSSTGQLGTGLGSNVTTVNHAASPYTVLAADQFISADVTAGVITIKLPNAPVTGRIIVIKDKAGLANTSNISVTTVGGVVTIDGVTTYTMNVNFQAISVIFDGSNYEVF